MRTWEQAIKFDSGLTVGRHCVELELNGFRRGALVEISNKGKVTMLAKPNAGDMYSSWMKIEGDSQQVQKGVGVIVWGARDPELMKMFANPVAVIRKN